VSEGKNVTPGSLSKFLMAAFVRIFAQKVTAEMCPVQPLVISHLITLIYEGSLMFPTF
jgi:hypothetical protein